jgi:hypothetical protein
MTARRRQWNRGVVLGGTDLPIVVVKSQIEGRRDYSQHYCK